MAEVALNAELRQTNGSAPTRRLRKDGRIPGVLYGHGIEPLALSVNARELRGALRTEAGANALINLDVSGQKHLAFTRDLQRHPVRGTVDHVDFLVVNRNEEITAEVPLTFIGEPEGVTRMGGIVEHLYTTIEVTATAATLPTHIDLDVSGLVLDEPLRIRDIVLPSGVTTGMELDDSVVVGRLPRAAVESTDEASTEGSTEEGGSASTEAS